MLNFLITFFSLSFGINSYVNGGLNIVFSHLPSKVLSILTLIGFGGDRKKGEFE